MTLRNRALSTGVSAAGEQCSFSRYTESTPWPHITGKGLKQSLQRAWTSWRPELKDNCNIPPEFGKLTVSGSRSSWDGPSLHYKPCSCLCPCGWPAHTDVCCERAEKRGVKRKWEKWRARTTPVIPMLEGVKVKTSPSQSVERVALGFFLKQVEKVPRKAIFVLLQKQPISFSSALRFPWLQAGRQTKDNSTFQLMLQCIKNLQGTSQRLLWVVKGW